MRPLVLMLLSCACTSSCGESIIACYDGDKLTLVSQEDVIGDTRFVVETVSYQQKTLMKMTTANASSAVRFSDDPAIFLAIAEDQAVKLIIVGSAKGGVKMVFRRNQMMRYDPVPEADLKPFWAILEPHFVKYPLRN